MVTNLPSNAGDSGLIPGQGTKIPHAAQMHCSWGKPMCCNEDPAENKKTGNLVMWSLWNAASLAFEFSVSAKSCQSCLTLCNPMDGSPLGSSVHGILQARVLEWVAISFSRGSS